jgi:hypothetical protein
MRPWGIRSQDLQPFLGELAAIRSAIDGSWRHDPGGLGDCLPPTCWEAPRRRHSSIGGLRQSFGCTHHSLVPRASVDANGKLEVMVSRIPVQVRPLQPTLVTPFHRQGWVYKEKVDSWRLGAYKFPAGLDGVSPGGSLEPPGDSPAPSP